MKKKFLGLGLCALLLALSFAADAQQPKKLARVCYLGNTVTVEEGMMKPFRERLREIGYVEGQSLLIDYRYWEGKVERLPELAAEFVRLNCDVILTTGSEAVQTAKDVIKKIPVVMAFGADAVKLGIVAELAELPQLQAV